MEEKVRPIYEEVTGEDTVSVPVHRKRVCGCASPSVDQNCYTATMPFDRFEVLNSWLDENGNWMVEGTVTGLVKPNLTINGVSYEAVSKAPYFEA